MNRKQKNLLYRVIISAVLFCFLLVLLKTGALDPVPVPARILAFAVPYFLVGADVYRSAFRNIRNGQVFDEHFLMVIATLAAFGIGEYAEACAVMLFYQIGELFQSYAVGRSRASIAAMMSIAPESANLETEDGLEDVDPDEVEPGSVIVIRPGERIPLDGVVLEGSSWLDTSALTGESVPRAVSPGDEVISGCVNGDTLLRVRTTKCYEDSTVARILELVENASEKKARLEQFITRFARWYTPLVTVCAVLLAVVPPLLLHQPFGVFVKRACIFLIVSCPCALVISVPLGFFGGIGAASRIGVLVKGANCLEAVAGMDTIVFDKTGTLTEGSFRVTEICPENRTEQELLELAAFAESGSDHPIARSVLEAWGKPVDRSRVQEVRETAGRGVTAKVDGRTVLAGNLLLLKEAGIFPEETGRTGTVVYVAVDGEFAGTVLISDRIKEGAREAIAALYQAGVKRSVMLTGDRREAAAEAAGQLGITDLRAELLPGDKVQRVEELLKEGGTVGFAGDGINDAPVLMRADIGIAMGSLGSDAAIEAADVVLMDDDLRKIAALVRIARKTSRIVRQNVVFALGVKALVLLLGALGMANLWAAVFGDVGVTVLAVLNSMRMLGTNAGPAGGASTPG